MISCSRFTGMCVRADNFGVCTRARKGLPHMSDAIKNEVPFHDTLRKALNFWLPRGLVRISARL